MGVVSGNLEAIARAKLRLAGISKEWLSVGGFGSDHTRDTITFDFARDRILLLEKVGARLGIDPRSTPCFHIGDTPADVLSANAAGFRSIGVATGKYTLEQLEACHPWRAFASLADVDAVFDAIFAAAKP